MGADWKDTLSALKAGGSVPEGPEEEAPAEERGEGRAARQPGKLHIVMERKGRGGKTATIIEGFSCPDSELLEVAAHLKKKIGVGGSARGGEILLQGDRRQQAAALLKEMGFHV